MLRYVMPYHVILYYVLYVYLILLILRNIMLNHDITYPYGWTVNFEMCRNAGQSWAYQPPIPNSSQTSAWSHRYIGHWIGKTEDSPAGIRKNFRGLNGWKKPWQTCSISHLWEHFWSPEHRMPMWLLFEHSDVMTTSRNSKFSIFPWCIAFLAIDSKMKFTKPLFYWVTRAFGIVV